MKKWNFKRVMLTAATVTAGLFLLAGCGGKKSSSSNGKVTIQYWNHWAADSGEGKWFQAKIEEYEKLHPNIKIKQTHVPINDYTGSKLTTAFATGNGPDMFSSSAGTINTFVDSGVAANLNDIFSKSMRKDYTKASLKAVTYKGKILAMPIEQDLVGLFYDKDLLDKNHMAVPKTWDELRADAKKLTTDKRSGIIFEPVKGAFENFIFEPLVWQQGGDLFKKNGDPNVDSKPVINALAFIRSMAKDGSLNLKPDRPGSDNATIGEGQTAFWWGGSFGVHDLETKYAKRNIQVAPLPIPEGGKPASVAGGWRLVANAQGKHLKETKAFMKWLFLDKSGDHALQYNTVARFSYSPRQSVLKRGSKIYQKGLRKVFTNEIYGTEKPEEAMSPKDADTVGDMIQNALFKMSASKAAKIAQAKMEENHKK